METWAFCASCDRWFYVPTITDEIRLDPACPACETLSQRVVQSGGRVLTSALRIAQP